MTTFDTAALIVGCGHLAVESARLIGRRHPLFVVDVDEARVDAAIATLAADGLRADGCVCDITDAASVVRLSGRLREGPPLGAVAHVAGLAPSCGDWRRLVSVNLIGPHRIADAVEPLLADGAAAVFVASSAAFVVDLAPAVMAVLAEPLAPDFLDRLAEASPLPINASIGYVLSKAAVVAFCETLAVRWGPRGARAVSMSPGLILSEMGARETAHDPSRLRFVDQTPLKREGSVAEAVEVIDFLASPAASFINGVDLLVDGGGRAAARVAARAART